VSLMCKSVYACVSVICVSVSVYICVCQKLNVI